MAKTSDVQDGGIELLPASSAMPLTVHVARRRLTMHWVSETELDGIAGGDASIHFGFFGISVGALISFGTVLSTTTISDPKTYAT